MSSTNKIEIIKPDTVVKIDVTASVYYTFKQHVVDLIEEYGDAESLFTKITTENAELNNNEKSIKYFLDVIAEIERTAKENNQTEVVNLVVKDNTNQDPS